MKLVVSISILVFSTFFGWIGQLIDHGNFLGGWSIILGTIGAFVGLWIGIKINNYYF